jgi:2'-5' RNA ligase
MSVRSRLAEPPVQAVKAFGGGVPPAIQAGEAASQMTPATAFSPGEPIGPYDGYSRTPRSRDYVPGYNIATRPRTHERVSFEVLKGLIDNYDVAQLCIRHRIASIRSLDWKLITADGYDGDITDAIPVGMEALRRPDRKTLFTPWLAKWLRDILSYDAGALERMRNRAGRAVGLRVVSGRTLAPLLDYWGDSPDAPAPAYVQFAQGLPFNWLTREDLIYEPYDPQPDSIYGRAPLEDVLLNANTDIRFQLYFLQRFTEGNIPEAFASAPEKWSPDEIENWQNLWDSVMYGDQSRKSQIHWMPGGTTIAWSNEKDFTDSFSLFLMRKTCAAFSVVPTDLGFTENANLASGESQADVQHKVGDLPLAHHVQDILSAFLQDDLGLPLRFAFDLGEEQDDRLNQAQSDQIYIQNGVVGPSEIREMRYGLPEPEGQSVPRYIFTTRGGPVPLSSLLAVAGPIDPQTSAPVPGAPLPHTAFEEVEGVIPNPPLLSPPLAEQEYGVSALPPAPPPQPGAPVAKEGEGAPAAGITADSGIYGYDGPGEDDDEEKRRIAGQMTVAEDPQRAAVAKELAAFRRFERARRKAGTWRDFRFDAVDAGTARRLNAGGQQAIAKGAVPGLSPCSGMISLDVPDGLIEPVPGGVDDFHVTVVYLGPDVDDEAFAAACDRAQAAAAAMPGPLPGTLAGVDSFPASGSSDGKVPAYVPASLPGAAPLRAALADLSASEHADWQPHVTLAYVDEGDPLPDPLPSTPVTFTQLSVHRGGDVERFPLGCGSEPDGGDEATCPCGTPVIYDEGNGWQHADGSISHDDGESVSDKMTAVAKAADAGPKVQAPSGQQAWAGWRLNDKAVAYWAPLVTAAITAALTRPKLHQIAADYLAANPQQQGDAPQKRDRNDAAYVWLVAWLSAHGVTLDASTLAQGILADGYLIGSVSAAAVAGGTAADLGGWKPGDADAASGRVGDLGGADALTAYLAAQAGDAAGEITGTALGAVSRSLAGADGDSDPGTLGAALRKLLADVALAAGAVFAMLCGATAKAADDFYCGYGSEPPGLGLGDFQWVTDPTLNNCAICLDNEAAPPREYGEPWPSGDTSTGIHVKCGCALIRA